MKNLSKFEEHLDKKYDDRYVKISDCNDIQDRTNAKFANDDKRIDLMSQRLKINNWLTIIIASGVITLVIETFFK